MGMWVLDRRESDADDQELAELIKQCEACLHRSNIADDPAVRKLYRRRLAALAHEAAQRGVQLSFYVESS